MAAGQDERAEMLAMRRDMPQGIVEVGPVAPRTLSGGPEDGYLSGTVQDTTTAVPLRPMKAWNVYSDVVKPDRVFFDPDMTAEDVRQALIRHDGYSENIRVTLSVHQPGDRCQCGNPWTVKIDERLYCGQCAPTPMELQEPCLCGEDVKRGCLQACRLSEAVDHEYAFDIGLRAVARVMAPNEQAALSELGLIESWGTLQEHPNVRVTEFSYDSEAFPAHMFEVDGDVKDGYERLAVDSHAGVASQDALTELVAQVRDLIASPAIVKINRVKDALARYDLADETRRTTTNG